MNVGRALIIESVSLVLKCTTGANKFISVEIKLENKLVCWSSTLQLNNLLNCHTNRSSWGMFPFNKTLCP